MKKTTLLTLAAAVSIGAFVQAQTTFYSQGNNFPTSGANWNTARDGTGTGGNSQTYRFSGNDLVITANSTQMYFNSYNNSTDKIPEPYDTFDGNSYLFENGAIMTNRSNSSNSYATWNGGNLTVDANATFAILNQYNGGAANIAGGFQGTADVILGSTSTLQLDTRFSASNGIFDFGLNIVGSGTVDFDFANADATWLFTGLTNDFTGVLQGDTFNGAIQIADGTNTLATLALGRGDGTRDGKIDLAGQFSVGALSIDNISVASGVYTHADLVTLDAGFANNLIDNGGTIYVGQAIPEPSTITLLILSFAGLGLVHRLKRG